MFDSGVLDVALGLTVVFILVSTVCTALREALESVLKTRAAYLEYAIRALLLAEREDPELVKSFYEHPLIRGLSKTGLDLTKSVKPSRFARGEDMPSYIPSRSFATALIDIVVRGRNLTSAPSTERMSFGLLRQSVERLENRYVQRAMLAAIDSAHGDLERARKELEAWFDGAMNRVSGWYKRSTQTIIFGIACVVVFAMNINAISIANTLYRDQAVRAAAVAVAGTLAPGQSGAEVALSKLESLELPLGWEGRWDRFGEKLESGRLEVWNDIVTPLLGLLLTVFAATLGAPFWFDVLNKVMVIRATVKPNEKSPPEASEDRQFPTPAAPASRPVFAAGWFAATSAAFVPDNDVDGCELEDDDPTPDEALPPATGGVR